MYVQTLPTEVLHKRVGDLVNFVAQAGRVPGGAIKGATDIALAPAMLAESVAGDVTNFKQTISDMKDYGQRVSNLVKSGATRKDLAYLPTPSQMAAIENNINAWRAGDADALARQAPRYGEYTPTTNVSKPVTETASKIHSKVDNWTNSWVPDPKTNAATFGSIVADQLGRALPLAGLTIAKSGLNASSILRGTPLSYTGAALQGIGAEGVEGSGQPGRMLISGLAEGVSEQLGGKLFSPLASKAGSKTVSAGIDAIGEGLEENISGGIFSVLTGDPYSLSDAISDFAVGTAVGGAITTGVNTYNLLRGENSTTAKQYSLKNTPKQNSTSVSNRVSGLVGLSTNVPASGTTGARLISLSGNNLVDVPTAQMGQSGTGQQMQIGNIELQGSALLSTPQTEPWKFDNSQILRLVTPDESTRTNIIQFPKVETTSTPQEQPGQIIPFPQTSETDNQNNSQTDTQQQINLIQQISQPQIIPQSQTEQNTDIGIDIPAEIPQTVETQTQSLPEILPTITTEISQINLPETTVTGQSTNKSIATEQNQAQFQTQGQIQEQSSARAAQIWSPAQAMLEQTTRQNIRQRRDRDISGYDFNLSVGQGSTGRIYETSGYNATFGGLSSY